MSQGLTENNDNDELTLINKHLCNSNKTKIKFNLTSLCAVVCL